MTTKSELQPCPWCPSTKALLCSDAPHKCWVECYGCGARGPIGKGFAAARRLWNERSVEK